MGDVDGQFELTNPEAHSNLGLLVTDEKAEPTILAPAEGVVRFTTFSVSTSQGDLARPDQTTDQTKKPSKEKIASESAAPSADPFAVSHNERFS